jgi:hypothetical protein
MVEGTENLFIFENVGGGYTLYKLITYSIMHGHCAQRTLYSHMHNSLPPEIPTHSSFHQLIHSHRGR